MTKTNGTKMVDPNMVHGCMFLNAPFPECYCMNIRSTNITKILNFCADAYQSCQIYGLKKEEKNCLVPARIQAVEQLVME
jgi:hypothetical protein